MRKLSIILLAAVLGVSSGVLAACGNRNGLLPRTEAERLKASVDSVAAAVNSGDCARATSALLQAQNRADSLPPDVDPKLRDAIQDGLSQLVQNVQAKCRTTTTQRTQTETVPTQTTTTTPTETTTTPTETTTTPTETTPTETLPSEGDDTGGTPPGQRRRGGRQGEQD